MICPRNGVTEGFAAYGRIGTPALVSASEIVKSQERSQSHPSSGRATLCERTSASPTLTSS